MKIFDRENIDELLKIRHIRQYFPPSKFCTVQYIANYCDSIHNHEVSVLLSG